MSILNTNSITNTKKNIFQIKKLLTNISNSNLKFDQKQNDEQTQNDVPSRLYFLNLKINIFTFFLLIFF